MKRTIAIVCGGDTSEHDVSMRSAAGIETFLDQERYIVYKVEIHAGKWEAILEDGRRAPVDRNDFSFSVRGERVRPDFAYITIHGAPGENGVLQGYFDLINMPYSTCNLLVEAMTYDKFVLNNYMRALGVKVADSLLIKRGHDHEVSDQDIIGRIGLPCFVKPASGGSSFGTTKVKSAEALRPAIDLALKEGEDVMVEAFMQGTEITCGCYKTKTVSHVFPITEVVTTNEFFDYDAKYNGQVQEITPARIPDSVRDRVQQLTSTIYDVLGCSGIIRIDYIITEGNTINLLEINTTPGMTVTSFIPQQVRAAGLDIKQVMTDIIEDKF
ncbi:MAG: D-alanine--D-alanine ligase [Bacteroidaceae bacterium]|nr:D-alanine--D-alanine ligase [Prevotellaceae bacterium]MDY5631778.1 D-alanine--D-alanine ligase [Bacteroidaceae bacterium]